MRDAKSDTLRSLLLASSSFFVPLDVFFDQQSGMLLSTEKLVESLDTHIILKPEIAATPVKCLIEFESSQRFRQAKIPPTLQRLVEVIGRGKSFHRELVRLCETRYLPKQKVRDAFDAAKIAPHSIHLFGPDGKVRSVESTLCALVTYPHDKEAFWKYLQSFHQTCYITGVVAPRALGLSLQGASLVTVGLFIRRAIMDVSWLSQGIDVASAVRMSKDLVVKLPVILFLMVTQGLHKVYDDHKGRQRQEFNHWFNKVVRTIDTVVRVADLVFRITHRQR